MWIYAQISVFDAHTDIEFTIQAEKDSERDFKEVVDMDTNIFVKPGYGYRIGMVFSVGYKYPI